MMPDADESYSVGQTAKLLFVSRLFVLKLLEQGNLELHFRTVDDAFITHESVHRYLANQESARRAYQAIATDEE